MQVTKNTNLKVVHILPAMNFGGVEVAVKKSYPVLNNFFDYRVVTVLFKGKINCNQLDVFSFFKSVIFGKRRPDVVVTSLWIAHPIGFLLKIFGVRWIAFFHNASYTHNPDKIFLPLAARFANDCMADSEATSVFMKKVANRNYSIVPYIFPADSQNTTDQPSNDFIWIGRNDDQKRLDLVYKFVCLLATQIKSASLKLIVSGNPYEPFDSLKSISGWNVQIFNSIPNHEVTKFLSRSRFYILLSDFEGMSMSTIEAVQAGCVPIVRPVGEIGNYLDKESAILVNGDTDSDLQLALTAVVNLWENEEELIKMKKRAINKVSKMGDYCESFVYAIKNL